MKKYENFIKMLHDKWCVMNMQCAMNVTADLIDVLPEEERLSMRKECVSSTVSRMVRRDSKFRKAFDQAAFELMFDRIDADFDLKKDKSTFDPLAKILEAMFGYLNKTIK